MARPDARLVAEWCEHRAERSPADQATGGVVMPNGTRIVSQHDGFLAACVRHLCGFSLPAKKRRAA